MYIAKQSTIKALKEAFGFDVEVVSSKAFEAHGERRTRYTVKRPTGSKAYHAIMYTNGSVVVA